MYTKILLKSIFQKIFNNDIIYVICKYFKKKWYICSSNFKQIKVKNGKKEKHKYSFHYYYH